MTIIPNAQSVADLAAAGAGGGGLSAKKILQKMTELQPKTVFTCIAQFGPPEELLYVMQTEIDGVTFQGIGNSKKSAKVMAATYALLYANQIQSSDAEKPPEYTSWPMSTEDFTEDLIDPASYLYGDFSSAYLSNKVGLRDPKEGPGYIDESMKDGRQDEEYFLEVDQKTLKFLGRNPLGIAGELLQDAEFEFIEESLEPGEPLFVAALHTNGMTFNGVANSKKLARARAAKDALAELFDIQFTAHAEDGMPLYEGASDQLWQTYKAKLEADAEASLRISVADQDAQAVLRALYPSLDVVCRMVGTAGTTRHIAQYYIGADVYEAEALTEDDACRSAAETAVTALRVSGKLYERERELEGSIAQDLMPKAEHDRQKPNTRINAISKLMQLYAPDGVKFIEHSETKLPETNITAFTLVVWIGSQPFVGVSKSKRGAKLDVAVKVLKGIGKWTADDEENLKIALKEEDPVEASSKHKEKLEEIRQTKIKKMLRGKGVPHHLIEAGFNLYSTWNTGQDGQETAAAAAAGYAGPWGSPEAFMGMIGPSGYNPMMNPQSAAAGYPMMNQQGGYDMNQGGSNMMNNQAGFPMNQGGGYNNPWNMGGGNESFQQGGMVQYPNVQQQRGGGRGARAHPYMRGGGGGMHDNNQGKGGWQGGTAAQGGFEAAGAKKPQQSQISVVGGAQRNTGDGVQQYSNTAAAADSTQSYYQTNMGTAEQQSSYQTNAYYNNNTTYQQQYAGTNDGNTTGGFSNVGTAAAGSYGSSNGSYGVSGSTGAAYETGGGTMYGAYGSIVDSYNSGNTAGAYAGTGNTVGTYGGSGTALGGGYGDSAAAGYGNTGNTAAAYGNATGDYGSMGTSGYGSSGNMMGGGYGSSSTVDMSGSTGLGGGYGTSGNTYGSTVGYGQQQQQQQHWWS